MVKKNTTYYCMGLSFDWSPLLCMKTSSSSYVDTFIICSFRGPLGFLQLIPLLSLPRWRCRTNSQEAVRPGPWSVALCLCVDSCITRVRDFLFLIPTDSTDVWRMPGVRWELTCETLVSLTEVWLIRPKHASPFTQLCLKFDISHWYIPNQWISIFARSDWLLKTSSGYPALFTGL